MSASNAGLHWTLEEEEALYAETGNGMSVAAIAAAHGRTKGGITSRQRQMGLRNEEGEVISPLPEFKSYLGARREHGTRPSASALTTTSPREAKARAARRARKAAAAEGTPASASFPPWPKDFPRDGNLVEMLWHALRNDIAALPAKSHLDSLNEREIDVALARLSPGDEFHPTAKLSELGEKYNVTRERIRQIENRVVRRLRAGIQRRRNLTARVLAKVEDAVPDDQCEAILSWFAAEIGRQNCGKSFTEFVLMALVVTRKGKPTKQARQLVKLAMPSVHQISRGGVSAERRSGENGEAKPSVQSANAFVLGILKKATWPTHLNEKPVDLSGFQPLRACISDRPYYSKTLQRLVGFDSLGERRLIRALDICTVVTEFTEQPVKIGYRDERGDRIYIPDLLVRTDTDLYFVVEIKGRHRLADRRTLAKATAAERYLGDRGIGYCLVDENGFGLDDLRSLTPDDEFEHRLQHLLRQKEVVTRRVFERGFDRPKLRWAYDQLQNAVLRNDMRYETRLIARTDIPTRYIFDFELRAE